MSSAFLAEALVLLDHVPSRNRHDKFLALGSPTATYVADLRVLDGERRGLAYLPADQLLQVDRSRGHGLEPHQRHSGDDVRDDEANPSRPSHTLEHAIERRHDRGAVLRVRRRERWDQRRRRQRLDGVRCDNRPPAPPLDRSGRYAAGGDLDGNARCNRIGHRKKTAHSTKVTLLISRRVVTPAMTCSTADSRRNRIPSSRAAFLISDVGRFARIISR